jgi:hypothetical protein
MIEMSLSPRIFLAQMDIDLTVQLANTGNGPCTGVTGTLVPSRGVRMVDGRERINVPRLDVGAPHLHRITVQSEQPGRFELRVASGSYTDERPQRQHLQQTWTLEVLPKPAEPPPVPTTSSSPVRPRRHQVFISYRWDEAIHLADRLAEELCRQLGRGQVFQDRDRLQPGLPFPRRMEAALRHTAVMLVLIGPRWNPVVGTGRRLDSEQDWIRREVSSALTAQIPTIPVFFDDAPRPVCHELPEDMRALVEMDWRTVGVLDCKEDIARVVRAVRRHIRPAGQPGR